MNRDLVEQFDILYNYFRSQNDRGRIIAYNKAIIALKSVDTKITNIDQIKNIRGIGPKIIAKVKEYLDTGKISAVETAKRELKKEKILTAKEKSLRDFETIWGIGPSKAQKLYEQGIHSIKDLKMNTYLLTEQQKIGLKYREDLQEKIPRNIITSIYVIMKTYLDKNMVKINMIWKLPDHIVAGLKNLEI